MLSIYERTIYKDERSGFCILGFHTTDESVPPDARNGYYRDALIHFTATGYKLPESKSIQLELNGTWQKSKYGLQLSVESFTEIIPQTKEGILGYLSSGLIKGVGEKTAKNMVNAFGLDTLRVLEKNPAALLTVKGITQAKLDKIRTSFLESSVLREVVTFLAPFGVSVKKCAKIQNEFGDLTMKILREQPFRLCEISGFGFKTVDQIARKVHCRPDDPLRIKGAILYTMDDSSVSGNTFLPQAEACRRAGQLLNEDFSEEVVSENEVNANLYDLVMDDKLTQQADRVYKPRLYAAEHETANAIAGMLLAHKGSTDPRLDSEIEKSQKRLGLLLSEKQQEAVRTCICEPISIITGGPGTGKTTVLRAILDVYQHLGGVGVLQAAPTGRASRRMMESTGLPASTLHSALGLVTDDEDGEYMLSKEPLDAQFVVVDEMSMVDILLAKELFTRIRPGTKVLLVGDADQLPSVGPGNVFRDLIMSGLIPVTRLDVVFRQAGTSRIAMNSQYIQQNQTNLLYGSDFAFLPCANDGEAADLVVQQYLAEVSRLGIDRVQVLAPFRSRGHASVKALNERLRDEVNPEKPGVPELKCGARLYRLGDRVLQTKNRAEISNGDIGVIRGILIDPEDHSTTVEIEFSDNRAVEYNEEDMDNIELAYAMTIHKSQGSEYATVIMPLLTSYYIMLRRNLIYTGITRAKQKVIIVGQKQALFMAIHKNDTDSRNSLLDSLIPQMFYSVKDSKAGTRDSEESDCVQLKMSV